MLEVMGSVEAMGECGGGWNKTEKLYLVKEIYGT